LRCERVANTGNGSETILLDQLANLDGQSGDGSSTPLVCASFEAVVAALQLQQGPNILQCGSNGKLVWQAIPSPGVRTLDRNNKSYTELVGPAT